MGHATVGQSIPRVDSLDKVLGRTRYAADLSMPHMLYARALLSEYPSTRIGRIHTERARALDGVVAVVTSTDVPNPGKFGVIVQDQPVLVGEGQEARFTGEALALVAAESEKAAERAIRLIEVEYEELPGLYGIDEALQEGARRLHHDKPGNICASAEFLQGDPEQAFKEADVVIQETYVTPRQEHAYIELEAGLAHVDDQGRLHVVSCLQDPYYFLRDISGALGIPMNKVRVASPPLGGGFGGKLDLTIQPWIALLALRTNRPVKMVLTREESFRLHPKRHPMRITVKLGANRDGRILTMSAKVLSDAGAYTGRSPTVLRVNQMALPGPYNIPHIRLEGQAVFTNNPLSGAFRGYGAPQAVFAREAAMDLLARELEMDPLQLRLKNFLKEGDKPANRFVLIDSPVSLSQVAERLVEAAGPLPEASSIRERIGRGLAFDMPSFDIGVFPGIGLTGVGAAIQVFQDGSVAVYSSAVDMGQGVATVLAQVTAESLGVPVEDVSVVLGDSWTAPKAGPSSGSRQTYVSGNAILMATRKLRERLLQRAGQELEIDLRDLVIEGRRIFPADRSGPGIELARVAALCFHEGISLREEAWFKAGHGALMGHTFMASLADVAVDLGTGKVKILRLVCAHDAGKAINPLAAESQLCGGGIQSCGYALTENMPCRNGKVQTSSLTEYLLPTSMDAPERLIPVIVEEPYPTGPYGAKGMGEHVMCTTPPAILNAVCQATGVKLNALPAHPQEVLLALECQETPEAERLG